MTSAGNYWKQREKACFDFLESMKHAIRMSTLHELNQETLEEIFIDAEQRAFLDLYSDRINTLVGDEFDIRETVDPDFVVHCYRAVSIRHPKGQPLTDKDLLQITEDRLPIKVEIFGESEIGPTDLLVSNGNIAIIIGVNEWCMYIARVIWGDFDRNYLNESLATSYEHTKKD